MHMKSCIVRSYAMHILAVTPVQACLWLYECMLCIILQALNVLRQLRQRFCTIVLHSVGNGHHTKYHHPTHKLPPHMLAYSMDKRGSVPSTVHTCSCGMFRQCAYLWLLQSIITCISHKAYTHYKITTCTCIGIRSIHISHA